MAIFTGAGVAIVTPMKENKEVDYEAFAKLIDFQVENGTDAIIVCGTTGESSTLTHEEHIDVIRFCVKQVNGRLPVIPKRRFTSRRRPKRQAWTDFC